MASAPTSVGYTGGISPALAMDIATPAKVSERTKLLVCLPGGGASRQYFDMGGTENRQFSFARAMTAAGHVVAMIDPPGVGENPRVDDPYGFTVDKQIPELSRAVEHIRADFADLPIVGVGHSAGAMLTAMLQDHSDCYDALALLCFGTGGLPQFLEGDYLDLVEKDPEEARRRLPEFARQRFPEPYFHSPMRQECGDRRAALEAVNVPTLAPVGMLAMTPGNIAPELARITVPVFTAAGEFDMVGPHENLALAYSGCPDFTRVSVAGAGHSIFLADAAPAFFRRFAGWLDNLTFGENA